MSATVELRAFRNETILARTLVHNSIERANIIISGGHHLTIQIKLESGLCNGALLATGSNASFQVKLASVLILGRLGMNSCEGYLAFAFVARLRIIGCIRGRRGARCENLRWVLLVPSFDREALHAAAHICSRWRHDRCVGSVCWREVVHLE